MHDVVAIEVELEDGGTRFFVTWGRIQDPVDPSPLSTMVMSHVASFLASDRAVRARVCDSLKEAASSDCAPYFYEALLGFNVASIPFGSGYENWRTQRAAAMAAGREISYCGSPPDS